MRKQRQWIFVTVAAVGLLPILYGIFFLYFSEWKQLAQQTEQLEKLRTYQLSLEKQQVPAPYQAGMAADWFAKVPLAVHEEDLLQLFMEVETRSGARMESVQSNEEEDQSPSGQTAPNEGIVVHSLTMRVAGTYEQAMAFWQQLAEMERLVSIHSWTLTPTNTSGSIDHMSVLLNLDIDVYTSPGFTQLQ